MGLRVVAVRVLEVTSSCRIEGRREEGEGSRAFFDLKEKQWLARAEVLDHNKARTCVSACV